MGYFQKNNRKNIMGYFSQYDNQCFPIEIIWKENETNNTIGIVDSHNIFIPPSSIVEKQEEILSTYKDSIVFNNDCIRLTNIEVIGNKLILYTERTKYFFTLITNRRMDFVLDNCHSIREIFEPNDKLSSLIDSKMSNHIGFSVLIETADNCLVFANRNKRVSTKKNLLDCGVSGSLKSKYALSSEGILTVKGFFDAISKEIIDELHLPITNTVRVAERNMIALYRDILEGGKPNFIFFYNISYTSKQLHSFVCESYDDKMCMDLDNLLTIDLSLFLNASIGLENILFQFDNTLYKMPISPSTGGVLAFFKEYLYRKDRL